MAFSWGLPSECSFSFKMLVALFFAGVDCIIGFRPTDIASVWKPLKDASDVHDDLLNYTFDANEFQAPWGASAATNDDVGISFGIFRAESQSFDALKRVHFDPWMARQHNDSFCLNCRLAEILAEVGKGLDIKAIAVFVHGFLDNGKGLPEIANNVIHGSWPAIAAASFSTLSPREYLGVAVDWELGASGKLHYPRAMSTTRVVGSYLARLLSVTRNVFGSKVQTWCVGQSLGAHVCGLGGKYAARDSNARWDKISGLDPAGPSVTFLRSVSTSWVDPAFQNARLRPDDAKYTEVLHTDWGGLGFHPVLAACIDKQHWYSTWRFGDCSKPRVRLGHLEAFVNPRNYTAAGTLYPSWLPDQAFEQPGCNHVHLFCSHHFSKNLLMFTLSHQAQGGALTLDTTCGALQMEQEPLDVCPRGRVASPTSILKADFAHSEAADTAYSFDGLRAPSVEDLAKRYPDALSLRNDLVALEMDPQEDVKWV